MARQLRVIGELGRAVGATGMVAGTALAQAILQGVSGGEEKPAVEPDDSDARDHLVTGVLFRFAEDLRTGFTSKGRHLRMGGHPDKPDERESDPDDYARLAELKIIDDPKPPNTRSRYLTAESKLRGLSELTNIDFDEMDLVLWSMKTGEILK